MLEKAMRHHIQRLHEKKHRREAGEFLVEGIKGVKEALQSSYEVLALVVDGKMREDAEIAECIVLAERNEVGVAFAGREDISHIKTTETFPGVLAVLAIPDIYAEDTPMGDIILALDGISDPGNLGTIIRTADWFGCTRIILGEGCVDPYNDKVVRSTMGSFFRITLQETEQLAKTLERMKGAGYALRAAELNGLPITQMKKRAKAVYILGSESHGVRPEISAISEHITIPGIGHAESLNVAMAAGIILYTVRVL